MCQGHNLHCPKQTKQSSPPGVFVCASLSFFSQSARVRYEAEVLKCERRVAEANLFTTSGSGASDASTTPSLQRPTNEGSGIRRPLQPPGYSPSMKSSSSISADDVGTEERHRGARTEGVAALVHPESGGESSLDRQRMQVLSESPPLALMVTHAPSASESSANDVRLYSDEEDTKNDDGS